MKPTRIEQKVRRYRNIIPVFACESGCHACCGPVPASSWEIAQLPVKTFGADERMLAEMKQGRVVGCRFLGEQGCTVYENRPLVCRMFGAVDNPRMKCPKGCGPKKPLSAEKEAEILLFMQQAPHEIV